MEEEFYGDLHIVCINHQCRDLFLVAAVHRNEFQREADSAVMEALNIGATAAALSGFEAGSGRIAQMGIKYRENGTYIQIRGQDSGGGTGKSSV